MLFEKNHFILCDGASYFNYFTNSPEPSNNNILVFAGDY